MIEIDGVRSKLEEPIWESGDYISDEWLRVIGLATHPNTDVYPLLMEGLASAVRRLNRNLTTTSFLLGESELAPVYDDVVRQVNDINSDRPVGLLKPLMTRVRWGEASGSYISADSRA
jgi:hypothetical protein